MPVCTPKGARSVVLAGAEGGLRPEEGALYMAGRDVARGWLDGCSGVVLPGAGPTPCGLPPCPFSCPFTRGRTFSVMCASARTSVRAVGGV